MADDGSFCIVTKSENYSSAVRVYNKKFALESEYSRNDRVISAEISPDGKKIAVLSLDASSGDSLATLTVLERGKDKTRASISLKGVLPYCAKFVSNDRIALVGSDYTAVYDLDCREKTKTEYSKQVAKISASDGGYAILFEDNSMDSSFTLSVFGENGNKVSDHKLEGYVSDIALYENYVYVLMDGEVLRIDTLFGNTSRATHSAENAKLVVFDDGTVTVCTNTVAYYISFN
jgi:WD40 repeat protein